MSDLISRSALLKEFEEMNAKGTSDLWHITGIKALIENQPTAYDVDKVCEEMGAKALEKQIPKKPKKIRSKVSDVIIHYYCPACERRFGQRGVNNTIMFPKEKYCNNCGQALDWSEEDEGKTGGVNE